MEINGLFYIIHKTIKDFLMKIYNMYQKQSLITLKNNKKYKKYCLKFI